MKLKKIDEIEIKKIKEGNEKRKKDKR